VSAKCVDPYPSREALRLGDNKIALIKTRNNRKTIKIIATVTADRKITVQLPPDIPAGKHKVVVVIDEQPLVEKQVTKEKRSPLNFPVDNYGSWGENLSLRREDMYDDWGR